MKKLNFNKLKSSLEKIKPENIFIFFGLFIGLLNILLVPPFQVPDENRHFYRIYKLSEGVFNAQKIDNRVGDYVPSEVYEFAEKFPFKFFNPKNRIPKDYVLNTVKYKYQSNSDTFADFPANYSLISYLPQTISFFILRIFQTKPFYIYYITKFFMLILWITIFYFAIKIIPFYKWLFTVLALLPMSIFVNSSLSADSMTNSIIFFTFAYFIKHYYIENKLSNNNLFIILFLSVFLTLCKFVYFPLVFLVLLFPKEKFKSNKNALFFKLSIILISFSLIIGYSKLFNQLSISYKDYNVEYRDKCIGVNSNVNRQIEFIKDNPLKSIQIFSRFHTQFNFIFRSYIGKLGWLDTNLPPWYYYFSLFIILLFASTDSTLHKFSNKKKILFLVLFISISFGIVLSLFLTWSSVGAKEVNGVQGRYFIPIMPLFYFLFSNSKIELKSVYKNIILFLFLIVSFVVTYNVLSTRYFLI